MRLYDEFKEILKIQKLRRSVSFAGFSAFTTLIIYAYVNNTNSVDWSEQIKFSTPPSGGSDELRFVAFGDTGKTPLDTSKEHYILPGALSVIKAIANEVDSNNLNSVFHIGDISYATGFLAEWDFFMHLSPVALRVSYMTAIGNHERDYVNSGSVYPTPDSGGECGVPYETYFPMPTSSKDKPWYSIEQASVHFTVISTEHDWSIDSEQYEWMKKDMASVNRQHTPWLIFMAIRAGYSRADQYYASYPAGTELLTDTTKLYKAALGNCFEFEEWGAFEFCVMEKHFERQGKSPYAYHVQYMAHLLSHGQLDGSG